MSRFKNKYRIKTTRLQGWDYSSPGRYFITGCTLHREHFFGEIINNVMHLSPAGEIAMNIIDEILIRYPHFNKDIWQVMPNHIHGILTIKKNSKTPIITSANDYLEFTNELNAFLITPMRFLRAIDDGGKGGCTGISNPMLHQNLSTILRSYSARCSHDIRKLNQQFGWQERFFEHLIRNDEEYKKIYKYIEENPRNWKNDKYF